MIFKTSEKKNQRAFPRINVVNDAYFMIEDDSENNDTIKCWCKNLSEGGLAFNTEVKIPDETTFLRIIYRINSKYRNDKLVIKSKNKDFNYNRYGCEFAENDQERNALISKFIQEQA